jgi:hypothetical protein
MDRAAGLDAYQGAANGHHMRQDAVQKPQDRTRLGQAGGKVKGGSVVREQGSGFSGEKTGGRRQETGSGDRWAWRHRRGLAGWLWRGFAHSERVLRRDPPGGGGRGRWRVARNRE